MGKKAGKNKRPHHGKGKSSCVSSAPTTRGRNGRGSMNREFAGGDDDSRFRSKLVNDGYIIREQNRSLSDQLYDDSGGQYDTVRHQICGYLEKNKDEFACFLLMEDDDEDVLSIDCYINKMREDGEWGGNVEVVVASRLYRRNVIVFSSEAYSDGALSITCDDPDKDPDAPDLLLSYHGNDHYNSVLGMAARRNKREQECGSNSKSPKDKKKKGGKGVDESKHSSNDVIGRPPTRGSSCPCGSGLKYKTCCMKKDKIAKRAAKHKQLTRDASNEEKKDDEFIGMFKVMQI